MPLEQLGASERTKRIRQKILAAAPLPANATASDAIDVVEGRVWRKVDGCCDPPTLRIAYIEAGAECPSAYDECVVPASPSVTTFGSTPLLVGTNLELTNLILNPVIPPVEYRLGVPVTGADPPIETPVTTGTVSSGETATYVVQAGDIITGMASYV